MRRSGVTRAGAISFDDAYTKGIADAFRDFAPAYGITVPNLAKVELGFLTNSVHAGLKQVHGDLTLVCRLRDMHELGIKHTMIAVQTRGDLMYFASTMVQTGYLLDTQLYFTEVLDSPAIDNWDELTGWQAWYTGHGPEPLNGWWDAPEAAPEPVPVYVKNGSELRSVDLGTCTNLIGTVTRGPSSTTVTLEGRTGTLEAGAAAGAYTIRWSDGSSWTKRPHATQEALMRQIVGGVGSVFQLDGPMLYNWFLPRVWQTVDPLVYPDLDGDRTSVTAYTPAVADATFTIAIALNSLIEQGADYMDGELLYAAIKATRFTGLSGSVAFDSSGDRADSTYIIFNYADYYTKTIVASVSGDTYTETIVAPVYVGNRTVPLPDGGCAITDTLTGEVCSGHGVCEYGPGVCTCDFEHLGPSCETYIPRPCSIEDTAITVGACGADNTRTVLTSFTRECCDATRFPGARTRCDTGIPLPPPVSVECDHVVPDSDIGMAFMAIGIIGAVLLVAFIGAVLLRYSSPAFVMGQPPFLVLCCVGGIVGIVTISVYPGAWTTERCRLLAALPSVGFTVMLTSVVLKAWRVDAIFNNKSLYMMNVGPSEMLKRFSIIFGADLLLLLLFLFVNGVKASTHEETVSGKTLRYTSCTADEFYFGYVLLLYKFVLMFYGVMLAMRVRSAKSDFSESKYITLAIYNTAAAAIVGGYLFLFAELDEEAKYAAFGVCTFLVFTITPTIMIAPRCAPRTRDPRRPQAPAGARADAADAAAPRPSPPGPQDVRRLGQGGRGRHRGQRRLRGDAGQHDEHQGRLQPHDDGQRRLLALGPPRQAERADLRDARGAAGGDQDAQGDARERAEAVGRASLPQCKATTDRAPSLLTRTKERSTGRSPPQGDPRSVRGGAPPPHTPPWRRLRRRGYVLVVGSPDDARSEAFSRRRPSTCLSIAASFAFICARLLLA